MTTHAVILAGGLARRLGGGDKGLLQLGGLSMLDRIAAVLTPQVQALVLNANGDAGRFAALGLPVVPDRRPDRPGPLAGVLAGLDHAAGAGAAWLLSVPCDTPALPDDLVARLHQARREAGAAGALAVSGGRRHPVIALWSVALRPDLEALLTGGVRAVERAVGGFGFAAAEWAVVPSDPFLNVNTPADADRVRAVLRERVEPAGNGASSEQQDDPVPTND